MAIPPREPDVDALRALALTAEHGSLSAAAAILGVTQQGVSVRIRSLEATLKVRLLARSPRGSRLTPAGELVAGWAAPLLDAATDFTAATRTLAAHRASRLSLAASLTIAEFLMPAWIARWRASLGQDGPLVHLTAANSRAVIEAVRAGTVDLGLIETPSIPGDLGTTRIGVDTIEVVTATTHPWAASRRVSAATVAATALVLREEGSGTRQALEEALAGAGHPLTAPPVAVASTTLDVRSAIMAGYGPGALSALAVADDVRAGRLARIRVTNLTIARPLTAIWATSRPSPVVRNFLEHAPARA